MVAAGLAMLVLAVAAIVMVLLADRSGDDQEDTGGFQPPSCTGVAEQESTDERVLVCAE